jgi:molecular chaperone IbpA
MTRTLSLRSLDIPQFQKFGIGFDSMFDELLRTHDLQSNTTYPPYNVVKHNENNFSIELAVAGFKEGDIEVTLEKNQLSITGNKAKPVSELDSETVYLVHGISSRSFERIFTLAEHVSVSGAVTEAGILTINLERVVPEESKPKRIAINYTK